jgi:hypothetical protein
MHIPVSAGRVTILRIKHELYRTQAWGRWRRVALLIASVLVVLAPSTGIASTRQPHALYGNAVMTCSQDQSATTWSALLAGKLVGGSAGYYDGNVSGLGVYAFLRQQACHQRTAPAQSFGACVVQHTPAGLWGVDPYAVWVCGGPLE